MSDRALADALAEFAGVDASAEPCVAADGAVLPLGLRQPELVIDLEDFVSDPLSQGGNRGSSQRSMRVMTSAAALSLRGGECGGRVCSPPARRRITGRRRA